MSNEKENLKSPISDAKGSYGKHFINSEVKENKSDTHQELNESEFSNSRTSIKNSIDLDDPECKPKYLPSTQDQQPNLTDYQFDSYVDDSNLNDSIPYNRESIPKTKKSFQSNMNDSKNTEEGQEDVDNSNINIKSNSIDYSANDHYIKDSNISNFDKKDEIIEIYPSIAIKNNIEFFIDNFDKMQNPNILDNKIITSNFSVKIKQNEFNEIFNFNKNIKKKQDETLSKYFTKNKMEKQNLDKINSILSRNDKIDQESISQNIIRNNVSDENIGSKLQNQSITSVDETLLLTENKNNNYFVFDLEKQFEKFKDIKFLEKENLFSTLYTSEQNTNQKDQNETISKKPKKNLSLNNVLNNPIGNINKSKIKAINLSHIKKDHIETFYQNYNSCEVITRSKDDINNILINEDIYKSIQTKKDGPNINQFFNNLITNKEKIMNHYPKNVDILEKVNNLNDVKSIDNLNLELDQAEIITISGSVNHNLKSLIKKMTLNCKKLNSNLSEQIKYFTNVPSFRLENERLKKINQNLSNSLKNRLNKLKKDEKMNDILHKSNIFFNDLEIIKDKFLSKENSLIIKNEENLNKTINLNNRHEKVKILAKDFKIKKSSIDETKNISSNFNSKLSSPMNFIALEKNFLEFDQIRSIIDKSQTLINKHNSDQIKDYINLIDKNIQYTKLEIKEIGNKKYNPQKSKDYNDFISKKLSSIGNVSELTSNKKPTDLIITCSPENSFLNQSLDYYNKNFSDNQNKDQNYSAIKELTKFNKQITLDKNQKLKKNIELNARFNILKNSKSNEKFKEKLYEPYVSIIQKDKINSFIDQNEKFSKQFNFLQNSFSTDSVLKTYLTEKDHGKKNNEILVKNNLRIKTSLDNNFKNLEFNNNSIDIEEINNAFASIYSEEQNLKNINSLFKKESNLIQNCNSTFKNIFDRNISLNIFPFNLNLKSSYENYKYNAIKNNKNLDENLKRLHVKTLFKCEQMDINKILTKAEVISLQTRLNKNENFEIINFLQAKTTKINEGLFNNKRIKLYKINEKHIELNSFNKDNRNLIFDNDFDLIIKEHLEEKLFRKGIIKRETNFSNLLVSINQNELNLFPLNSVMKIPVLKNNIFSFNKINSCLINVNQKAIKNLIENSKLPLSEKSILDENQFINLFPKKLETHKTRSLEENERIVIRSTLENIGMIELLRNLKIENFENNKLINIPVKPFKLSRSNNNLIFKNFLKDINDDLLKYRKSNEEDLDKAINYCKNISLKNNNIRAIDALTEVNQEDLTENIVGSGSNSDRAGAQKNKDSDIIEIRNFDHCILNDTSRKISNFIGKNIYEEKAKPYENILNRTTFSFNDHRKSPICNSLNQDIASKLSARLSSMIAIQNLDNLDNDLLENIKKIKNYYKEFLKIINQNTNYINKLIFLEKKFFFFINYAIEFYKIIFFIYEFISNQEIKEEFNKIIVKEFDTNGSFELDKTIILTNSLLKNIDINNPDFRKILFDIFKNACNFVKEKTDLMNHIIEEFNLVKNWGTDLQKNLRIKENIENSIHLIMNNKKDLINKLNHLEKAIITLKNQMVNKFEPYFSQVIEVNIDSCFENDIPYIESRLENIKYNSVSIEFMKGILNYAKENTNKSLTEKKQYYESLFMDTEKLLPNKAYKENILRIKHKIETLDQKDQKFIIKDRKKEIIEPQTPINEYLKDLEDQSKKMTRIVEFHNSKISCLRTEKEKIDECEKREKEIWTKEQASIIALWENLIKGAFLIMFVLLISRILSRFGMI